MQFTFIIQYIFYHQFNDFWQKKMFFMILSVFQVTLSSACLIINEHSWDAVLLMRLDSSPNSPTWLIYRFSDSQQTICCLTERV